MLRSSLEKVLSQLDEIADALKIHERDRNAHINNAPHNPFRIYVDIGEINVGTGHRLVFDTSGNLLECWHERWGMGDNILRTPVRLPSLGLGEYRRPVTIHFT